MAGTLSGPQQVREDRPDQRPQLRSARRGRQPDHQLRRPAGRARQDRHAARRVPASTSSPRSSARTPKARARRSCCASTARCPPTCAPRSPTPSAPDCWKWWTCREIGGHRRRRHRPRGHRRGAQGARRGAARRREDELRPRCPALPRDRGDAARRRRSTSCAATTRSCWAPSAIRRCPAVCWSAGCCCACGSRSTTTSTCARRGCIRGSSSPLAGDPDDRLRRRPRGHRGPVHRHRWRDPRRHAARGRHRGQPQHRVRRAARGARRVRAGRPSGAST